MRKNTLFIFGEFELDPEGRLLKRGSDVVPLQPTAFATLCYFVENVDRLLTRDELLDRIWPEEDVEMGRVDATVVQIRKALGGVRDEFIQTVPKSRKLRDGGYRWRVPVVKKEVAEEAPDSRCPFLGLQFLTIEDADLFFGRENELKLLVSRLQTSNFLVLLGGSGAGKSSLVRAGLAKALGAQGLLENHSWELRVFRPGPNPLAEFANQLTKLNESSPPDYVVRNLQARLQNDTSGSHDWIERYFEGHVECQRMIWIVDQFETLFTQCPNESERLAFVAALLWMASNLAHRCVVLLTLRADYYSAVLNRRQSAFRRLGQIISENLVPLSPPDEDDLRAMMIGPATLARLKFEETLVDTILADIGQQFGALPLLAHTLRELYDRRDGQWLTLVAYNKVGGVAGSIATRADRIFRSLSKECQLVARHIMVRLSQASKVGEGRGVVGQRVSVDELSVLLQKPALVREVIDTFIEERLLIPFADEQTGSIWVEVIHEALINHWPRLLTWLREDRAALLVQERLMRATFEWYESARDANRLVRGRALSEAVALQEERPELVGESERTFITESLTLLEQQKYKEVQRSRRRKIFLALVVGFLCVAIPVSLSWRQNRQREIGQRLAADSLAQLSYDPELSLMLALKATRYAQTNQIADVLRQAMLASRIRKVIRGHSGPIVSASVSPDGSRIVTASGDKTARLWDTSTGMLIATLSGHEKRVNSAVFSPDGLLIATGSEDNSARIWNATTGGLLRELRGHTNSVNQVAFSGDGKFVVSASGDTTARIWDVQSGDSLKILQGHEKHLNSATFSPNANYVATGSGDKTVRIWDWRSGMTKIVLADHSASVLNAAFSTDGKLLITSSVDRTAMIWEVESWKRKAVLIGHEDQVNTAEFSADSKRVVTASKDRTVRVWDTENGTLIFKLLGHTGGVNSAVFSRDGRLVISASGDQTARVWDVTSFPARLEISHDAEIYSSTFSPDQKLLLTASKDKTAKLWTFETGTLIATLPYSDSVQSAAFSPDGTMIATSGADGTAMIWSSSTLARLAELRGHKAIVNSIAFSPDGKHVITGSGDNTARIWDVSTGKSAVELRGHSDWVNTAAFSADGKYVITASRDNTGRIWDALTGQYLWEFRVATGYVNSAVFNADGKLIVAACGDGITRLYDAEKREQIASFHGHNLWINYAEFSPDGGFILTASGDKTARVWSVLTRREVFQLHGHDGSVLDAHFSANGRWITTASSDHRARVYDCAVCGSIDELIVSAKQRVTRDFTQFERLMYRID